jgi:hypothetical protein
LRGLRQQQVHLHFIPWTKPQTTGSSSRLGDCTWEPTGLRRVKGVADQWTN